MDLYYPHGYRNAWWLVQTGSFCPKFWYFSDQNKLQGVPHENEFNYYQIQLWISLRVQTVDEKVGSSSNFLP